MLGARTDLWLGRNEMWPGQTGQEGIERHSLAPEHYITDVQEPHDISVELGGQWSVTFE